MYSHVIGTLCVVCVIYLTQLGWSYAVVTRLFTYMFTLPGIA